MPENATIFANGRELTFAGTHEAYLKWYRGWDAAVGSVFKAAKDLPRGSLCLDAGANIGVTAITLAVQRPDFHIIAIEPVPDNVECLRRNVKANAIGNVEIIEAAVSDRHEQLPMSNNGPWSAVIAGAPVQCRAIPLDDYSAREVAFVKIDTEGYEPYALAGARKLLAAKKPLVHMEFNTLLLLLHHHDPVQFAKTIWSCFDVLAAYYQENSLPPPNGAVQIVHDNIVSHGSVTDLLLRPRSEIPELETMIYSPAMLALQKRSAEALEPHQ